MSVSAERRRGLVRGRGWGGALLVATLLGSGPVACAQKAGPERVVIVHPEGSDAARAVVELAFSRPLNLPDQWVLRPDERAGVAVDPVRGHLYTGARDGTLVALDPDLGEVVWELSVSGGVGSTPVVHEDTLLFGTDDGALVAIDLSTHEILWSYETDGVVRHPPIVDAGVVYMVNSREQIFALDIRDGSWRWQYERELPKDFTIQGRAGLLFVPADDAEASESGVLFTGFDDGRVVAIGASSGEALWITNLAPREVDQSGVFADVDSTPVLDVERGELVVAGASAGVYGLNLADGAVRWSQPFKGGGSLARAPDGNYIIASPLQGLASVTPGGGIRWTTPLNPAEYSSPVVIGDTGKDEEVIREAIDIGQRLRIGRHIGSHGSHRTFCAARGGAGDVKPSRSLRPTREHEARQRFEPLVRRVDRLLQPDDLRSHDAQGHLGGREVIAGRGEVGTKVEEVILDAEQRFGMVAAGKGHGGEAQHAVCLVHRTNRFHARRVLLQARSIDEPRGAVSAGARVDLVDLDHLAGPAGLVRDGENDRHHDHGQCLVLDASEHHAVLHQLHFGRIHLFAAFEVDLGALQECHDAADKADDHEDHQQDEDDGEECGHSAPDLGTGERNSSRKPPLPQILRQRQPVLARPSPVGQ